jgi:hypothetical protein
MLDLYDVNRQRKAGRYQVIGDAYDNNGLERDA